MRIRWTPLAAQDIQGISDCLRERYPQYASRPDTRPGVSQRVTFASSPMQKHGAARLLKG